MKIEDIIKKYLNYSSTDTKEDNNKDNKIYFEMFDIIYDYIKEKNIVINYENIQSICEKFSIPNNYFNDLLNYLKEKISMNKEDSLEKKISLLDNFKKDITIIYINSILQSKEISNIINLNDKPLRERISLLSDKEISKVLKFINYIDNIDNIINKTYKSIIDKFNSIFNNEKDASNKTDNNLDSNELQASFKENIENGLELLGRAEQLNDGKDASNETDNNLDSNELLASFKENTEKGLELLERAEQLNNENKERYYVKRINALSDERKRHLFEYIDFILDEEVDEIDKDSIDSFVKKYIIQIKKDC